jgi:hypothetical protein
MVGRQGAATYNKELSRFGSAGLLDGVFRLNSVEHFGKSDGPRISFITRYLHTDLEREIVHCRASLPDRPLAAVTAYFEPPRQKSAPPMPIPIPPGT